MASPSPSTLYDQAVNRICGDFRLFQKPMWALLPTPTICGILYVMAKSGRVQEIKEDLVNLDKFLKLVMNSGKQITQLHYIFKTFINILYEETAAEGEDLFVPALEAPFQQRCAVEMQFEDKRDALIRSGMALGTFLYDAGWPYESAAIHKQCLYMIMCKNDADSLIRSLQCCERLLMAQSDYSMFHEGKKTLVTAQHLVKKLESLGIELNLATVYIAFSNFEYMNSDYNKALRWSVKALRELRRVDNPDVRTVIEVLRKAGRSFSVKRELKKAKPLILETVHLAREIYGPKSVKYVDTLSDYADYLVKSDHAAEAVEVCTKVLNMRIESVGLYNLLTAIAFEDLAYATYVKEYSTGDFTGAKSCSEKGIYIMQLILPKKHIQVASTKRVLALVLEELAIESAGTELEAEYLRQAETLHLDALQLSNEVFGEMNLQTAKHYGNLGRLYQTMKKYEEAEMMNLKSISIKESLFGMCDYEVCLSVGHLASLYNFDLHQYDKAEKLHLRSIELGLKLFGETYSGLEYDYRGLIHLYQMKNDIFNALKYDRIMGEWKYLRDRMSMDEEPEENVQKTLSLRAPKDILKEVLELEWSHLKNEEEFFAELESR